MPAFRPRRPPSKNLVTLGFASRNGQIGKGQRPKVQELTDNLQYIKETIQSSSILEMQGNKIRRQNDWNKWVIPRECNPDILSSSAAAPSSDVNNLTARLVGVGLHELASSSSTVDRNHREVLLNGSTASNNQAPVVEDNAGHH